MKLKDAAKKLPVVSFFNYIIAEAQEDIFNRKKSFEFVTSKIFAHAAYAVIPLFAIVYYTKGVLETREWNVARQIEVKRENAENIQRTNLEELGREVQSYKIEERE